MSSSPITIPLHSKSDRYGLPLIIVFFLSVPVWALVEGSFLTAALTALFIGGYVWWLFRFVPSVLGASAEIDDRRLRLVRRGKVLWACEWSEIEDVLIPNFVSAAEEMHFVLRNQTKPNILRNVLGHLPRAELKEAIRRRLPAGVQIRNRVLGFRPSRSRYLIVGLIGSIGGVGCIALALDWLIPGSEPTELQLRLASLSVWLACVGMIAVGIGIVQLINYGAWRPELVGSKWANKEAARQTLFTALQMFEKGDFVSEHLQFAYPERTRLADAKRQGRLTWIGIFFFCLFWIGMAVWAHIDEIRNPNRKTDLLGMLFVDAMIAFIVGGAVSLTFYSAARERRLLPYLQARVVIEGTRLFVRDGDRLHEARITKPAQSTVFSRSSNSLGLTIMIVEAGGKTYAFDPLSMIRETGVE